MMHYGPNHSFVESFITSLSRVTESDWNASQLAAVNTIHAIEQKLDEGNLESTMAARTQQHRSQQLSAGADARAAAELVASQWKTGRHSFVKLAGDAAAALAVFDLLRLEKMIGVFVSFRFTGADLPLKWNDPSN